VRDGQPWQGHVIGGEANSPPYGSRGAIADMNGDGTLDVIAIGYSGAIWLYTNDGTPRDPDYWTSTQVAQVTDATEVCVIDADGDGDPDLVPVAPSMYGRPSDWFENPGAGARTPWARHAFVVSNEPTAMLGAPIRSADIDGDGDPDLAGIISREVTEEWGTYRARDNGWLENRGGEWQAHVLSDEDWTVLFSEFEIADLDRDGDADLVGPGFAYFGEVPVSWFEQQRGAGGGDLVAPPAAHGRFGPQRGGRGPGWRRYLRPGHFSRRRELRAVLATPAACPRPRAGRLLAPAPRRSRPDVGAAGPGPRALRPAR
jgi:hypothetical protein